MDISGIDVVLKDGEGSRVEEHPRAVGSGVGAAGELVIQYAVSEVAQNGDIGKCPYSVFIYAPGTWLCAMWKDARGDKIQNPLKIARLY
jgi:hypothetical protein